jgi:hypothetical protein
VYSRVKPTELVGRQVKVKGQDNIIRTSREFRQPVESALSVIASENSQHEVGHVI